MNISDGAFQLETRIALPKDEVHLWRIDLASVASTEQRWEQILAADERSRAARFHFSRDRQYFTATRAILRMIAAATLIRIRRNSCSSIPRKKSRRCIRLPRQINWSSTYRTRIRRHARLLAWTRTRRRRRTTTRQFRSRGDRPTFFFREGAASACCTFSCRAVSRLLSMLDPKGSLHQGARRRLVAFPFTNLTSP
jgi:hypothetical protein